MESKREWFGRHVPGVRPILVHEEDGTVAAWVSFEPFYGRPAYGHTAEISIYLDPAFRGRGLGKRLLREAMDMTADLGIKTLLGFIFSHNEPSIRLFKSYGFEEWGRLPDVAVMDGREYSLSIFGKRLHT